MVEDRSTAAGPEVSERVRHELAFTVGVEFSDDRSRKRATFGVDRGTFLAPRTDNIQRHADACHVVK